MESLDLKYELKVITDSFEEVKKLLDLDELNKRINELDQLTYAQDFWNDQSKAQVVIKEQKTLKNTVDKYSNINELFDELVLTKEFIELGEDMLSDFVELLKKYNQAVDNFKMLMLLNGDYDKYDAIVEIHPGAGGTESQDWAEMLYRMYRRYAEINNYKVEVLDYISGDEAGIKSVTFSLSGDYSYGYLKGESGVHRLVRISPFDSGGRRHTSFASVLVTPNIDDTVNIEINENELKIDTYRSSGAGGQSVNTTDSAVRITHVPTKIVVTVQNERSQIKNREKALQILKSKLYLHELAIKQDQINSFRSDNLSNSFGSQIRSYVMHPYSMVKDHRTLTETGNVQKVMDGDLTDFINDYLRMNARGGL